MMLWRWAVRPHFFDLPLVQYYDLFECFDIQFVSGADLENYWVDFSHIAQT